MSRAPVDEQEHRIAGVDTGSGVTGRARVTVVIPMYMSRPTSMLAWRLCSPSRRRTGAASWWTMDRATAPASTRWPMRLRVWRLCGRRIVGSRRRATSAWRGRGRPLSCSSTPTTCCTRRRSPGCCRAWRRHRRLRPPSARFRKVLADGSPYPGEKPLGRVAYPSGDILEAMLQNNFLANGGHVLVRTEAARHVGGFDERLRLSEDWEFWCRLALEGPFAYIGAEPECLYLRVAPASASGGMAPELGRPPAGPSRRCWVIRYSGSLLAPGLAAANGRRCGQSICGKPRG